MQTYESLALVVSRALGGSKESDTPADMGPVPQTEGDLMAALARTLG